MQRYGIIQEIDRRGSLVRYWISAQSPPLEASPARQLDSLSLAAGRAAARLELEMERGPGQSRVFVVAHSVSQKMRELCASYGIECFAVDEDPVRSWAGRRTSANDASTGREPSRC